MGTGPVALNSAESAIPRFKIDICGYGNRFCPERKSRSGRSEPYNANIDRRSGTVTVHPLPCALIPPHRGHFRFARPHSSFLYHIWAIERVETHTTSEQAAPKHFRALSLPNQKSRFFYFFSFFFNFFRQLFLVLHHKRKKGRNGGGPVSGRHACACVPGLGGAGDVGFRAVAVAWRLLGPRTRSQTI